MGVMMVDLMDVLLVDLKAGSKAFVMVEKTAELRVFLTVELMVSWRVEKKDMMSVY